MERLGSGTRSARASPAESSTPRSPGSARPGAARRAGYEPIMQPRVVMSIRQRDGPPSASGRMPTSRPACSPPRIAAALFRARAVPSPVLAQRGGAARDIACSTRHGLHLQSRRAPSRRARRPPWQPASVDRAYDPFTAATSTSCSAVGNDDQSIAVAPGGGRPALAAIRGSRRTPIAF